MRHKITLLLLILMAIVLGCVNRSQVTPLEDTQVRSNGIHPNEALELVAQTDCYFMGIKVITILPGQLQAQLEDDGGIYFYAAKFKNAAHSYYKKAGIFIPSDETSEPYAFAEKDSHNSLAILNCDTLNFTRTKR